MGHPMEPVVQATDYSHNASCSRMKKIDRSRSGRKPGRGARISEAIGMCNRELVWDAGGMLCVAVTQPKHGYIF